jgi:AcrR family transcriptional regulator
MTSVERKSERAQRIVDAAAQLFALQGYHGTTTREIARLVEISENTIFRYFERKEDIFWAALRSRLDGLRLRRELVEGIARSGELEEIVPQLLGQLVDTIVLKPDLLRLLAIAFIELHWKASAVCHESLSPIFSAISQYLAENIKSGRMRQLDPMMVTTALLTTGLVLPEFSRVIARSAPAYSDNREAVHAYTEFWLELLVPRGATAKGMNGEFAASGGC